MKLKLRYKGGKGSGFHGHSGRPGMIGGSSSDDNTYPAFTSSIGIEKDLWDRATKNISLDALRSANIREFRIGSIPGEIGASGYENGKIILNGSDIETLAHEIGHAVDLSNFGQLPEIKIARYALARAGLITGAREHIAGLLSRIWTGRNSGESIWLEENNPDLLKKIIKLVTR